MLKIFEEQYRVADKEVEFQEIELSPNREYVKMLEECGVQGLV